MKTKGCKLKACAVCRERVRLLDRVMCRVCNGVLGEMPSYALDLDALIEATAKRALSYAGRRRLREESK